MGKVWTKAEIAEVKNLNREDRSEIKKVAKRLGRTFAAVYTKVWQKQGKTGTRTKIAVKVRRERQSGKVRMTPGHVVVMDYKMITLIKGGVRIKL